MRRHTVLIGLLLLFFSFITTGCAAFIIGTGAGIAGGYMLSKDSAEGYVDGSSAKVWSVSREVLQDKGAIVFEDKAEGKMEASIDGTSVKVRLKEITEKTVKLKVTARKDLLPKVNMAQDVYVRIAKKLS